MKEELNMRVLPWRPIGYQFLSNQNFGNAYQLRVYAELETSGAGEQMINLVKKEIQLGKSLENLFLVHLSDTNSQKYKSLADYIHTTP